MAEKVVIEAQIKKGDPKNAVTALMDALCMGGFIVDPDIYGTMKDGKLTIEYTIANKIPDD